MRAGIEKTVDVIIPVYHPDETFGELLGRLLKQNIQPERIILMYTVKDSENIENIRYSLYTIVENENLESLRSLVATVSRKKLADMLLVLPVRKSEFDHAATRDAGAKKSEADYLLFMTQDALPADDKLIENLIKGLEENRAGICYARQLPRKDAALTEKLTRQYNYPQESRMQTKESIKTMGIKTYFCSDVCALYDREFYERLGGFVSPAIFNEDMIMASKVIEAGSSVFYAADARVVHSHSYTCMQQFHRNFDLGVSQKQYQEIFEKVSSEKEGAGFAKQIIFTLCKKGHFLKAIYFAWQCGFRLAGYQLGKNYKKLPHFILMKCTSNKDYILFQKKK